MNYIGLNTCDTANGEGVRVSLFVSGCSMNCKGCFNKEAWDPEAGELFTWEVEKEILDHLKNPYVKGLSILGGDPLEPCNIVAVTNLVRTVKARFPNKSIWLWTGRKYETVKELKVMEYIDVLIDGAYIERKKCNDKWRGSSNQRIIKLHPLVKSREGS